VSCLLGERRSILPSLCEAMWNSSTECPIMAHNGYGGPSQVDPMTMVSEPSPRGKDQAAEAVGDELETPKANGFTEGEATAQQAFPASSDDEHR
jgi:hypothetical protein